MMYFEPDSVLIYISDLYRIMQLWFTGKHGIHSFPFVIEMLMLLFAYGVILISDSVVGLKK